MKRKLFFWFEKLQITTNERRTMLILIVMLIAVAGLNQLDLYERYDEDFYQAYEIKFQELSEEALRQDSLIAEQHYPTSSAESGTNGERATLAQVSNAGSEAAEMTADTTEVDRDSINVNTAGLDRLQELPGIGPAIAERIIDYREENGPFEEISDLLNVRGIGEARLENIRPYITLE